MAGSHSKLESKQPKDNKIVEQLVDRYLKHLGLEKEKPSFEYLCKLQKQHIETIPHENIDGMFNFYCSLDIPHLLNKYINENRGGLCFELNYSLGWLLHQLGFQVEMILTDMQAYNHNKENNKYPAHPILIVYLNGKRFLTDAGASDFFRQPLILTLEEYSDQTGKYRVCEISEKQMAVQKFLEVPKEPQKFAWYNQFVFDKPRGPSKDFTYPAGYLTSTAYTRIWPGYLFTDLFKFSRMNPNGHRTIWGNKLLIREKNQRDQSELKNDLPRVLQEEFKVSATVAKKCVKPKRSMSVMFPNKPIDAKKILATPRRKSFSK